MRRTLADGNIVLGLNGLFKLTNLGGRWVHRGRREKLLLGYLYSLGLQEARNFVGSHDLRADLRLLADANLIERVPGKAIGTELADGDIVPGLSGLVKQTNLGRRWVDRLEQWGRRKEQLLAHLLLLESQEARNLVGSYDLRAGLRLLADANLIERLRGKAIGIELADGNIVRGLSGLLKLTDLGRRWVDRLERRGRQEEELLGHLLLLESQEARNLVGSYDLRADLRLLADANLIERVPGKTLGTELPDGNTVFGLNGFLRLTDLGRQWIGHID